jgi:hypothetical protein
VAPAAPETPGQPHGTAHADPQTGPGLPREPDRRVPEKVAPVRGISGILAA